VKESIKIDVPVRIIRILLGLIFLWAGLGKLFATPSFADTVARYKIFPVTLIDLIASVIILSEICLGILLLSGYKQRGSAIAAFLLLRNYLKTPHKGGWSTNLKELQPID